VYLSKLRQMHHSLELIGLKNRNAIQLADLIVEQQLQASKLKLVLSYQQPKNGDFCDSCCFQRLTSLSNLELFS